MTEGDVTGMVSQVQNCMLQGGDCEECQDNAIAWYSTHASPTNMEYLQDCLEDCNGIGGGGCEDSCDDICRMSPGTIQQFAGPDPCTLRFSNWGSSVHHPCQIIDRNWTAENGTATEFAGGLFSQITFNDPGTYEVCVDVVASNGNESCCNSVCTTVTISEGC